MCLRTKGNANRYNQHIVKLYFVKIISFLNFLTYVIATGGEEGGGVRCAPTGF